HDLFVGEIVACWVAEEALRNGRPDPKKVDPLAFAPSGGYVGLSDLLAPSFAAGKKLIGK
ncbi:MAG: flavin reductase family protein, partial [Synergistaceae bacterium]|nr:flavin reductase family protein [Synergistaceae bacterium]